VSFRNRRRPAPPQTDEVCPSDEAAHLFFDLECAHPDHRAGSLCRQAQEAVTLALGDAAPDSRLDGAWVVSVDPAPGPDRLLVSVALAGRAGENDLEAALAALVEMKPWLRSEVARAIHRKRVPDLAFRVMPEAAVTHG
jgi:ribosome-binding factor A